MILDPPARNKDTRQPSMSKEHKTNIATISRDDSVFLKQLPNLQNAEN